MKPRFIESIKILDGRVYNLALHQERVARTLKFHYGSSRFAPLDELIITPKEAREGLVKCRIVYSDAVISVDFQSYCFKNISHLKLVEHNAIEYRFKGENRDALNKLKESINSDDSGEILIVKNEQITDTSFSNVVFKNSSGLYTPSTYLLAGTKRQHLIEQGVVKEREIGVRNLQEYDAVYLINAMIDLEDEIGVEISQIMY